MNVEEWRSQIKRGTLEFCILLLVRRKPCYGYEIISKLEKWSIVAAKESTIYPLLRRLLKDGCLDCYWQETAEGLPPRKYYTITGAGLEYLAAMEEEWGMLLEAVESIREGLKMNKQLENYLAKVEKGLRSLPATERADIVKEIQSEMLELEGEGMTPEAIVRRLGDPKALARAYLGDAITKSSEFSPRKLLSVLAFYGYAGLSGIFVLPVTSISAVTFFLCGLLCPAAGLIKFGGFLVGRDISQIQFVVGSYSAGAVAMVPITLVLGALCLLLGWGCWRLTILVIRSLIRKK